METTAASPMIEAVGLSKFYRDFAAIRDVSFSIPAGQVVAFLGPNGAGKSTTMKILTGYLESVIEKSIRKLSKGYRQRVGMAQVLLHEPDVLIMDEPTGGLDPNQIREVRRTIREMAANRTILLSTHILQEVEAVADRVILISRGRIVFDGTPREMQGEHATLDEAFQSFTEGGPCPTAA